MTLIQASRVVVVARSRKDLESKLELETMSLMRLAYELGDRGILVTRLSPSVYAIELHPEVPFGLTTERCKWSGPVARS
jgi:hypothetical protein